MGGCDLGLGNALNRVSHGVVFGFDSLFVNDAARAELRVRDGIHETLYLNATADALDRVDSKAGSLLTHISMMIAVAAFVVSSTETSLAEQLIIGAEIFLYLMLALCCLRCLVFVDVPNGMQNLGAEKDSVRVLLREQAVVRGIILNFAIRWTFLVTFVFALSLAAHLIL